MRHNTTATRILLPALSWGALLQSAQNVRSVALAPWLFIPGLL